MSYELPKLPYEYNALEPVIDAKTMEMHHSKHHATYVAKLNEALEKYPEAANIPLEKLLTDVAVLPEEIKKAVVNHGGGHFNHSLFWQNMSPKFDQQPGGKLLEAIKQTFGEVESLREKFLAQATGVFGSGWGWLVSKNGRLELMTTANQETPLATGVKPLLGVDV